MPKCLNNKKLKVDFLTVWKASVLQFFGKEKMWYYEICPLQQHLLFYKISIFCDFGRNTTISW